LLTAAALLPLGCAFAPNQDHVVDGVVLVAPPPPQVEVMGSPPSADFVWISGYWSWVGNRHVWVGGHWAKPRPGHHWVAHQWVRQGDGWRLHPGHWARDN
jgi:hypothetical protein